MGTRVESDGHQHEMLDGMRCPHSWCDGFLRHDGSRVSCGTCERVIVRFE